MKIHSKAPIRVDLSGGTLDIWPLYLALEKPLTINLGISLFAETFLEFEENSSEPGAYFESIDLKVSQLIPWRELENIKVPGQLILHQRLTRYFYRLKLAQGLTQADFLKARLSVKTQAQSPAGAGLGGSSGLCISMIGALLQWSDPTNEVDRERCISIAKDIESEILNGPAGLQDYFGAAFGGLQSIYWNVHKHTRVAHPDAIASTVADRLILFYSGLSRNSGINNWQVFKDFFDKKNDVEGKMKRINSATQALHEALVKEDYNQAAAAIEQEWTARRELAPGISTPEMNAAFDIAKKDGISSVKVCGAGGGGCFFLFSPSGDPELKQRLISKIRSETVRVLPFSPVPQGLELRKVSL